MGASYNLLSCRGAMRNISLYGITQWHWFDTQPHLLLNAQDESPFTRWKGINYLATWWERERERKINSLLKRISVKWMKTGGAHGIIVIIVGSGLSYPSSIPEQDYLHFNLGIATSQEEKPWI